MRRIRGQGFVGVLVGAALAAVATMAFLRSTRLLVGSQGAQLSGLELVELRQQLAKGVDCLRTFPPGGGVCAASGYISLRDRNNRELIRAAGDTQIGSFRVLAYCDTSAPGSPMLEIRAAKLLRGRPIPASLTPGVLAAQPATNYETDPLLGLPWDFRHPQAVLSRQTVTGCTAGLLPQVLVPSGALVFFNRATCPLGWVTAPAASGRYVVSVPQGFTPGLQVGAPLGPSENRIVSEHTHGLSNVVTSLGGAFITDSPDETPSATSFTTGGVFTDFYPGSNQTHAPYVQLLLCQKI